jgi:hypothetical protein
MRKTIVLATIVALLTAGVIALEFKLPKPAAAQQPIDPAIISSHLLKLQPDLALP